MMRGALGVRAAFLPRPSSDHPDFDWEKQIFWDEQTDKDIEEALARGDERRAIRIMADHARSTGNLELYWTLQERLWAPLPPRGP